MVKGQESFNNLREFRAGIESCLFTEMNHISEAYVFQKTITTISEDSFLWFDYTTYNTTTEYEVTDFISKATEYSDSEKLNKILSLVDQSICSRKLDEKTFDLFASDGSTHRISLSAPLHANPIMEVYPETNEIRTFTNTIQYRTYENPFFNSTLYNAYSISTVFGINTVCTLQ